MKPQNVNPQSKSKNRKVTASIWSHSLDGRVWENLDLTGVFYESLFSEAENLPLLSATA